MENGCHFRKLNDFVKVSIFFDAILCIIYACNLSLLKFACKQVSYVLLYTESNSP